MIYTIDARGLISGALDASGNVPMDTDGRLQAANAREIAASQDALNALAVDTGGRALRNQNTFDQFINDAVAETSRYYLIAWRPEGADEKSENFKKIQITVVGRPELTVNAARGFFSTKSAPVPAAEDEKKTAKQESKADADLRGALNDSHSTQALPLQLSLIYLDTPANGPVLTTSIQAPTDFLSYGNEGRDAASLDVAGVVLNDQGKRGAGFKTELKVNPPTTTETTTESASSNVIYNNRSPLKPGIYQVRVAARDARSGILGSAMEWIVVPDLSSRQLSLSSLILGLETVTKRNAEAGQIQWSVDKRFAQNSQFEFMTFIYNSTPNNLTAQVQVYKDGRSVLSIPVKTITAGKDDPQRIPFKERINLAGLQAGRYLLEVTVQDRNSQKSASQQTSFSIY